MTECNYDEKLDEEKKDKKEEKSDMFDSSLDLMTKFPTYLDK